MADKWQAQVGQLRLVGGSRVEEPANLGIAERRSLLAIGGKGKGRLHTLVELGGDPLGREELSQDLVSAIAEEYFHAPGTVTYGLRQALLVANAYLLRANAQVSSEHRVGGAACVVLRAGEAFIAQAGRPMAYVIHQDQVQAFPDTVLEDEDASVLGQRQTAEIRLFHAAVQPGDTILMADGPMAQRLNLTNMEQVVFGGMDQVISNLRMVAPAQDCAAMVIQVGAVYTPAEDEQWTYTPVESPPTEDLEPPRRPVSSPLPAEPEESEFSSPTVEELESFEPPDRDIAFDAPAAAAGRERTPAARGPVRNGPAIGDQVGAAFTAAANTLRSLGASLLPDRKPRPAARRRRQTTQARGERGGEPRHMNWAVVAAIAIPVIALLFAGGYTAYRNWSLQSQFDSYLEAAELKRDIATSSASSPALAREYWLEVLAALDKASALQPDNADVQELRTQAETEIDRIDSVARLGQIYKLYEYTAPGSVPGRVIVAGLDIYVLDRGLGNVYHHALNDARNALRNPDADPALIKRGQSVEGQSVGGLLDIAWMREGGERQAGTLLILDRNGLLIEYDPTWEQFSAQTVGGRDAWRGPVAMHTFDANLYLLDPMANQVLKYWKDRYTTPPDPWIKQEGADLSMAVDIGIDGNIYVLHSDGVLIKYFGGQVAPFALAPLVKPLVRADALYLDLEEVAQYIYVADATERRIAQFDQEGAFIRQFQPAHGREDFFRQLAGIFVDERGGKLYYTAANALYVADIPSLQR
jgi:hypothetical protein